MKKGLLIGIAVIVTAVTGYLIYSFTQTPETEKSDSKIQDTTTETDVSEVKIAVIVPDGWTTVEGSVLDVQYMKGTASFMVTNDPFTSKELSEIVTQAKTTFENSFDNVQYLGDVQDLNVGGYEAKRFTFTANVAGLDMKYTYVYTVVDEKVYAITFGDMSTTFNDLSSDYESILENITFETI